MGLIDTDVIYLSPGSFYWLLILPLIIVSMWACTYICARYQCGIFLSLLEKAWRLSAPCLVVCHLSPAPAVSVLCRMVTTTMWAVPLPKTSCPRWRMAPCRLAQEVPVDPVPWKSIR